MSPAAASPERCPACQGELRPWRAATATDPQLAGRDRYPLARCVACGSARTELPPGGAPPDLYEGGTYGAARRGLDLVLEPLRSLVERDKLRFLSGLAPGSRVLELGAGDGRFVSRLTQCRVRRAGSRALGGGGGGGAGSRGPGGARHGRGARPRAGEPRRGRRLARARAPARSGWDPGRDRTMVAPGWPCRRRLPQPGQPPSPDRRRSMVSPGRASPSDALHCDRAPAAARALRLSARAGQSRGRGAESARHVADAAESDHGVTRTWRFGL